MKRITCLFILVMLVCSSYSFAEEPWDKFRYECESLLGEDLNYISNLPDVYSIDNMDGIYDDSSIYCYNYIGEPILTIQLDENGLVESLKKSYRFVLSPYDYYPYEYISNHTVVGESYSMRIESPATIFTYNGGKTVNDGVVNFIEETVNYSPHNNTSVIETNIYISKTEEIFETTDGFKILDNNIFQMNNSTYPKGVVVLEKDFLHGEDISSPVNNVNSFEDETEYISEGDEKYIDPNVFMNMLWNAGSATGQDKVKLENELFQYMIGQ